MQLEREALSLDLWFSEWETEHLRVQHRVDEVLHRERSPYQDIVIAKSREFGRMLVLDGVIQTTLRDEFVYHEMMAHVPLFSHENPKRVLVIGGGDGGTVREVLKHSEVESVHLVEIDERVVELSREYLPELAQGLNDSRVDVRIGDGIEYVKTRESEYDAVIIDSSDPMGPAEGLFTTEFYGNVARALRPDGVMVAQSGAPFFSPELVHSTFQAVAESFNTVHLFKATVPSYSVGPFSFIFATNRPHAVPKPKRQALGRFKTRYYSPDVHEAAFRLPVYLKELLAS